MNTLLAIFKSLLGAVCILCQIAKTCPFIADNNSHKLKMTASLLQPLHTYPDNIQPKISH